MKEFTFSTTQQGFTVTYSAFVDGVLIAQRQVEFQNQTQVADSIELFAQWNNRQKLDGIFAGVVPSHKARARLIDGLMMQMLLGGDL